MMSFLNQEGEGEVAYVDAQRNMAVAIGERDVKTDVNIKGRVRLDIDIVLSLLSLVYYILYSPGHDRQLLVSVQTLH